MSIPAQPRAIAGVASRLHAARPARWEDVVGSVGRDADLGPGQERRLMAGQDFLQTCDDGCYFNRPPERLVLEGYRHWLADFDTGSVAPWEMSFTLYTDMLGPEDGRRALTELSHFVRTLRRCAACPLRSFPFGAHHVCRDECLTLGLIAALQHRDEDAAATCLGAMTCPALKGQVGEAARCFAAMLSELELRLLPIPKHAIEDVLARAARKTVH